MRIRTQSLTFLCTKSFFGLPATDPELVGTEFRANHIFHLPRKSRLTLKILINIFNVLPAMIKIIQGIIDTFLKQFKFGIENILLFYKIFL